MHPRASRHVEMPTTTCARARAPIRASASHMCARRFQALAVHAHCYTRVCNVLGFKWMRVAQAAAPVRAGVCVADPVPAPAAPTQSRPGGRCLRRPGRTAAPAAAAAGPGPLAGPAAEAPAPAARTQGHTRREGGQRRMQTCWLRAKQGRQVATQPVGAAECRSQGTVCCAVPHIKYSCTTHHIPT